MAKTYAYDQAWEKERERLAGIEAVWDPGTTRVIESLPIREGWRCLEIGAGGGSIAQWLAERVTDAGSVVATDLDTRFLDAIEAPNLDVRRHDILADPLPEAEFDLVHARLVLEHVADRDVALKRLVSTLKPGGWVVLEDFDWGPVLDTPSSRAFCMPASSAKLFQKTIRAVLGLMEGIGYDPEYGRWLPAELRANGLIDVQSEGRTYLVRGGTPDVEFHRLSLAAMADRLVSSGALTAEEIEQTQAFLQDSFCAFMTPVLFAAWGHRPAL